MENQKGSAASTGLIVALGVIVLGLIGYIVMGPQEEAAKPAAEAPKENMGAAQPAGKSSIVWRMSDAGEADNIPYTSVTVLVNGEAYDMGKFQGTCAEIGASGGVDGKGLLAGELSAVQCWFAGGGDEIGVFAHEDGGFDILVGVLEEPIEGSAGFRGNFTGKYTILP
jgi:hypothetical protein